MCFATLPYRTCMIMIDEVYIFPVFRRSLFCSVFSDGIDPPSSPFWRGWPPIQPLWMASLYRSWIRRPWWDVRHGETTENAALSGWDVLGVYYHQVYNDEEGRLCQPHIEHCRALILSRTCLQTWSEDTQAWNSWLWDYDSIFFSWILFAKLDPARMEKLHVWAGPSGVMKLVLAHVASMRAEIIISLN